MKRHLQRPNSRLIVAHYYFFLNYILFGTFFLIYKKAFLCSLAAKVETKAKYCEKRGRQENPVGWQTYLSKIVEEGRRQDPVDDTTTIEIVPRCSPSYLPFTVSDNYTYAV